MDLNLTKILIMKEPVPILEKRRIQAEVLGPLFEEMVENIGHHQASSILETAIRKAAIKEGSHFRQQSDPSLSTIDNFVALMELWKAGGALEMEVLQQRETRFDFNVNRCRYAEMYREMGLEGIGHLLSCNRDGTFCEGFDPNLKLVRDQTLMEGASCCTFRYTLEKTQDED
jgi:hypothetical protein|tara:strand:- start:11585 stop:12100 length:516 start_codon:yes stop_codon:yes gene_type:complete